MINLGLRQIVKIETRRFKKANWDLTVSKGELLKRQEIVALGDSQLFRWLNKIVEDENQGDFKDYLIAVVSNSKTDFKRACKGFKFNGKEYVRLLGTTGGVKKNTVLFIRKDLHETIAEKIENGRDKTKPIIPAKYEAYKALVASQSFPVSMPNGVIVVKDIETSFKDEVIYVDGSQGDRPICEHRKDFEVKLNANDGYGLCTVDLMRRWSNEIKTKEDIEEEIDSYMYGGVCIRNAFLKGMVFPFDLIKFAEEVAHTYKIVDIWGYTHDIREVELVLTESMLKLWFAYSNIEEYFENCKKNDYTFSICKIPDKILDDVRDLNYQYLQSYELSDEDIAELCKPTLDWIKKCNCGDYESTLEFLGALDREVTEGDLDYVQALKTNPRMLGDTFILYKVNRLLKKIKDNAKIGKIKCEGNYQIIGIDPYALCQGMFGLKITGILKRGEVYSSYWSDKGVEEIVLYRSPMTSHNNIRKVQVSNSDECSKWFKYMRNVMMLNAWDTITIALNGADCDGDTVFSTNNSVLLRNTKNLPAINCVQKNCGKQIVTEELLQLANMNGFGNEVGIVTNRVTSMFDVLAKFPKDSEEYNELMYRITVSQHYQQLAIDKIKGIVAEPMPKSWYQQKECETDFDKSIVCENKPYFMTYIYAQNRGEYIKYIKDCLRKTKRIFRMELSELLTTLQEELNEEQKNYIFYFYKYLPVLDNNCTMNKICRYMEAQLNLIKEDTEDIKKTFNKSILKNGKRKDESKIEEIEELHKEYCKRLFEFAQTSLTVRIDKNDSLIYRKLFMKEFKIRAREICPDEVALCNMVVDICYDRKGKGEGAKQFVWDVCREQLIKNLESNRGKKTYDYE